MTEEYKTDRFKAQVDELDITRLLECPISLGIPESASVDVDGTVFDRAELNQYFGTKTLTNHPTKGGEVTAADFTAVPGESFYASVKAFGEDKYRHDEASIYNADKLLQFEGDLAKNAADLAVIQERFITAVIGGSEHKAEHPLAQNTPLNPSAEDYANRISHYKKELKELAELLARPFNYATDSVPAVEVKSASHAALKSEYIYAFDKKIFTLKEKLAAKITALERNQERRNKLVSNIQMLAKLGKTEEEMLSLGRSFEQEKIELEAANKNLHEKAKAKDTQQLKVLLSEKNRSNNAKMNELEKLIREFENIISTEVSKGEKITASQQRKYVLQVELAKLKAAQQENNALFSKVDSALQTKWDKEERQRIDKHRRKDRKRKSTAKKADVKDEKRDVLAIWKENELFLCRKAKEVCTNMPEEIENICKIIEGNERIVCKAVDEITNIFETSISQINAIYSDAEVEPLEENVLHQIKLVGERASHDMKEKAGVPDEKSDKRSSFSYTAYPAKTRLTKIAKCENIKDYACNELDKICELFKEIYTERTEFIYTLINDSLKTMRRASLTSDARKTAAVDSVPIKLRQYFNDIRKCVVNKQAEAVKLINALYPLGSDAPHSHEQQPTMPVAAGVAAAPTAVPAAAHITRVAAKTGSPLYTATSSSRDTSQIPSTTPSNPDSSSDQLTLKPY